MKALRHSPAVSGLSQGAINQHHIRHSHHGPFCSRPSSNAFLRGLKWPHVTFLLGEVPLKSAMTAVAISPQGSFFMQNMPSQPFPWNTETTCPEIEGFLCQHHWITSKGTWSKKKLQTISLSWHTKWYSIIWHWRIYIYFHCFQS